MNDKKLPLGHHLIELRNRLTWSVIAILVCTAVAFVFHQRILLALMGPAEGFANMPTGKPIYTDMTEFIGVAMKVSLLGGVVISFPFILYQAVMFAAPGLKGAERRYLYALLPFSLLAFATGALFGYRVLFPPAVKFLLTFGNEVATPYIRIGSYTGLMLTLLFWMGIVFQTPIVAFFLSKIGVVTAGSLARKWRYAIVVAFVLGALITPTFDPINQTLVAVPIIVMYWLGILLAWLGGRGGKARSRELTADVDHG